MTTGWLAAATQMRAREPNTPPQDFMLDAIPAATLPIYQSLELAHSMLECTLGSFITHYLELSKRLCYCVGHLSICL